MFICWIASEDGASVERFMRHFKQLSGYAYEKRTRQQLWKISYYDHVLRSEEAIRPIAEYIWQNPIRRGLVDSPEKYPYSGPRENMALRLRSSGSLAGLKTLHATRHGQV